MEHYLGTAGCLMLDEVPLPNGDAGEVASQSALASRARRLRAIPQTVRCASPSVTFGGLASHEEIAKDVVLL